MQFLPSTDEIIDQQQGQVPGSARLPPTEILPENQVRCHHPAPGSPAFRLTASGDRRLDQTGSG